MRTKIMRLICHLLFHPVLVDKIARLAVYRRCYCGKEYGRTFTILDKDKDES